MVCDDPAHFRSCNTVLVTAAALSITVGVFFGNNGRVR